jgi:hypothetical protein
MTDHTLQAAAVLLVAAASVTVLVESNRTQRPVLSVLTRAVYLIAKWWLCAARAWDAGLDQFRESWKSLEIAPTNERWLEREENK